MKSEGQAWQEGKGCQSLANTGRKQDSEHASDKSITTGLSAICAVLSAICAGLSAICAMLSAIYAML